jgi:dihydropteroate synthase
MSDPSGSDDILVARDGRLPLDRVAVMGVLNVTPDSFSDGGLWLDPDAAVKHALEMVTQGAAIIDVGGESTRPGAADVPRDEELRRVLPVIERLAAETDAAIAIDTRKAAVAVEAVRAGASIINDTTGEASDRTMDRAVVDTGAAVVLMHSRGTPLTMRSLTSYENVTVDVREFLRGRADELVAAGVDSRSIVLDPGFGFAKTPEQNLEMLRRLDELTSLPFPLLSGTSRKSFIGAVLDLPEDQRVEGTMATVAVSVMKGARLVRVHDVEAAVRTVRMIEAVQGATG